MAAADQVGATGRGPRPGQGQTHRVQEADGAQGGQEGLRGGDSAPVPRRRPERHPVRGLKLQSQHVTSASLPPCSSDPPFFGRSDDERETLFFLTALSGFLNEILCMTSCILDKPPLLTPLQKGSSFHKFIPESDSLKGWVFTFWFFFCEETRVSRFRFRGGGGLVLLNECRDSWLNVSLVRSFFFVFCPGLHRSSPFLDICEAGKGRGQGRWAWPFLPAHQDEAQQRKMRKTEKIKNEIERWLARTLLSVFMLIAIQYCCVSFNGK